MKEYSSQVSGLAGPNLVPHAGWMFESPLLSDGKSVTG